MGDWEIGGLGDWEIGGMRRPRRVSSPRRGATTVQWRVAPLRGAITHVRYRGRTSRWQRGGGALYGRDKRVPPVGHAAGTPHLPISQSPLLLGAVAETCDGAADAFRVCRVATGLSE